MPKKRLHRVNQAMIPHAVPLLWCERIPFILIVGVSAIPAVATGVVHWQPDLYAIVVFFPLWFGAMLLYRYDKRSAAKLLGHLAWRYERYAPHAASVGKRNQPRDAGAFKKFVAAMSARMVRS